MPKYQINYTGDDSVDFINVGDESDKSAKAQDKKSEKKAELIPEDQKIVDSIDAGIEEEAKPEEKKPATRKAAKKADESDKD